MDPAEQDATASNAKINGIKSAMVQPKAHLSSLRHLCRKMHCMGYTPLTIWGD